MRNKQEIIGWNDKSSELVITSRETIKVDGATDIEDALKKIDTRLTEIVRTVKGLKLEAEALKSLKERLKAGITANSVSGSPVTEEVQSSSAEIPQST